MSIVKVDSIPLQFDFAGGCNCCHCTGRQTVYVNSHAEVERFDKSKSKDHESDFSKSVTRVRQAVSNFLELHQFEDITAAAEKVLEPLKDATRVQLRHIRNINRSLWDLWSSSPSNTPKSSPKTPK